MRRSWREDVLAASIVCVALAFALACNSKGSSSSGSAPGAGDTKAATAAPEITLDAKALLKDYKDNEVAADQKYKGKVIQVTGTVDEIKKDIMDQIYVTGGTGAEFEIPQAQCFFDDSATAKAAALKKGQKVTIKGRVDGLMLNVLIKDSVFVN